VTAFLIPAGIYAATRTNCAPITSRQGDRLLGRAIHFTARWRGLERRWRPQLKGEACHREPPRSGIALRRCLRCRVLTDELEDLIDR
jgi:hypothetical protein